jgi:signal transduction histidine kinase
MMVGPNAFSLKTRLCEKREQPDPALSRRSAVVRYAIAVLAIALATQIRMLLDPLLGHDLPFATYFAAVVFVTWYCGWGPSLLTLVAGWGLGDYLFVGNRNTFLDEDTLDLVGGGLYWFIGLSIIFLGRKLSTEKSRAEANAATAQEREERLLLALAATGLGTCDYSPLDGKLELSEQAMKILGLDSNSPIKYAEILNRVHVDDRPRVEQRIRDATVLSGRSQPLEFRVIWPDGNIRQVVAEGKVFENGNGQIARCIGTLLDVTEQRRFETELMQRAEELRRKTLELTHTNEELEQFARLVAHDLRTPLVTLSLNAGLLAHLYKDKLDSEADEIINYILQNTTRMSKMISGLQDYSHLDSMPAARETCDSEAALNEALSKLSITLEEAHAHITHQPLPRVIGDQAQFTDLLRNLIDNAIKFRRDIPPDIEVSAEADGDEIHFAVRDNGMGIDPQHFGRIFQIFQRLNKENTQNNGLGLGLAVCKKIVERYGGKIWVESVPDQGSTFHFSFPNAPTSSSSTVIH